MITKIYHLRILLCIGLFAALGACDNGGNVEPLDLTDLPPTDNCPLNTATNTQKTSSRAIRPSQTGNILVFSATEGYRHESIVAGKIMLRNLAENNDWTISFSEDSADFNSTNLANFDVVVWLNTTGDVLNTAQQSAFENFIVGGGGYLGIHAAADTEYAWPWYGELVGAWFVSHPEIQSASLIVENNSATATAHFENGAMLTDEWYNFQTNPRASVEVLLSLDESSYNPGVNAMGDHPIAWQHSVGEGRAFYTGLGHTAASYSQQYFIQHIEGALIWAGRMEKNIEAWPGTAPPDSDFTSLTLATGLNEPMTIEISEAGEIFVIGRNGEFYVRESGGMAVRSQFSVNAANEGGLIGFALDPNFANNRYMYFHYTANSGVEHRISRIPLLNDNSLDFSSEVIMLTYDVDANCCHAAGDMDFDAEGNLYIATGDNTDPFESNGYTPIDERSGRAHFDAQRSSANTNDLRGKILRIKPEANGSYSIPEGNLFPSSALHRPEIYSMGHRNPFRIHVDKVTGFLYWGDIGADASGSSAQRGPGGTDEINITATPGNFGWPYLTGDNSSYIDFNFATQNSGAVFDPLNLQNESPNNTGATSLPPARGAWISLSHRATMIGDVYHWSSVIDDPYKLPSWFHNRLLYWNFNNDQMFAANTRDRESQAQRWLNTSRLAGIIDAEISPQNHRLYLLGYGGNCCDKPANAGMLVEVRYIGSGPPDSVDEIARYDIGDTVNLNLGGQVLSASANQQVSLRTTAVGNNEIFEIVDANDGAVAFRSVSSGLYISASEIETDALTVSGNEIGQAQRFAYVENPNGTVALRAYSNCNFVSLDTEFNSGAGALFANASSMESNTLFRLNFAQACEGTANYGIACRGESPAWLNFPEAPDASFSNVPSLLSQTGAFKSMQTLEPQDYLLPYDVISPLWSDRADKHRWFSVPSGKQIIWSEESAWQFPVGTVFIKHFDLPIDEEDGSVTHRLETRFIIVQQGGDVYGVTYKWRDDQSEADLLTASFEETYTITSEAGNWSQTWVYPGPEDCLSCHNAETEFILGVKTAALNKTWSYPSGVEDNQLRSLINLGLFSSAIDTAAIPTFPAHAALDDETASMETRLRSYWDINCGNCHGPQGIAANWDGRFTTAFELQGIVHGPLADQRNYFEDYGLENPFVVDPGNPENSILYIRSLSEDPADRMPALGRRLRHEAYIELLENWINSL